MDFQCIFKIEAGYFLSQFSLNGQILLDVYDILKPLSLVWTENTEIDFQCILSITVVFLKTQFDSNGRLKIQPQGKQNINHNQIILDVYDILKPLSLFWMVSTEIDFQCILSTTVAFFKLSLVEMVD